MAKRERKEPGDTLPDTVNSTNLGAYIPDLAGLPNAHAKANGETADPCH